MNLLDLSLFDYGSLAMKYLLKFKNEMLWFAVVTVYLISSTHGRRYDKCETSDGRQGVCVIKRYCREATSYPLLACDHDNNFCCPIPTTHRSTKPSEIPFSKPQNSSTPSLNLNVSTNNDEHNKNEKRSEHSPSKPVEGSYFDIPSKANKTESGLGNGRMPGISNTKPMREHRENDYGSKGLFPTTVSGKIDGQPKEVPKPNPPGRVKFEDYFPLPTNRPHRQPQGGSRGIFSPDISPAEFPSEPRKEISFSNKHNENASKERVNTDLNVLSSPPFSTVSYNPFRNEVEIQKLPLPHSGTNDSNDTTIKDYRFNPVTTSSAPPHVPACGVKPYNLFIAGGETSKNHEWPWMAAIFQRFKSSEQKIFICGGFLINTKYVLSAAHCFFYNSVKLPTSSFVLRLGSHNLDSGEEYTISDLVIHQHHSGGDNFNDIALVKIASKVYITDKIAPICLPSPDMITFDFLDRKATVAGWGDTTFRFGRSTALRHVTVPIVSIDECLAAYSKISGAAFLAKGSDHILCAGLKQGGRDACSGDSGGPLMLKTVLDQWIAVGIVSIGYRCGEPGYPGIYTRITHYLSWIRENMKNY